MGKKALVAYEDRRKKSRKVKEETPVVPLVAVPAGAECPPAPKSEIEYRRQVLFCLKALGRTDPVNDIEKSKDYIDHAEKAGVDPKTTAAIVDATLGHAHLKQSTFVAGASEESVAASPTRDEWQIIVTNPPANSRGAILSYVGPGEAYTVGRAIVLGGFYDDVEAQHVARSITEKYGATVTYGPKSTFGVSEVASEGHTPMAKVGEKWKNPHSNVVYTIVGVEPGTSRDRDRYKVKDDINGEHSFIMGWHLTKYNWVQVASEAKEDCGCSHVDELAPPVAAEEKVKEGTICRPFTRIERDPREFEMCMKRAAEIGPITNSKAIYELVYPDISRLDEEHFFVIMMDFRGQLRDYVRVALGQRHSVRTDVRDVTAAVLLSKCDAYALVHCHPSGHAAPSTADRQLTAAIRRSVDIVCSGRDNKGKGEQVVFTDHVVIGLNEYYSFADKELHKVKK